MNIKNVEGSYMKINDILLQKPELNKQREISQDKRANMAKNENEKVKGLQDQVKLSFKEMIDNARAKASNLPEVREEKVSALREAIQRGTYQVSNQELANAMIRNLLSEIA